ncbi:hypothetical protein CBL_02977 [Carabus blaptoides fortunei]
MSEERNNQHCFFGVQTDWKLLDKRNPIPNIETSENFSKYLLAVPMYLACSTEVYDPSKFWMQLRGEQTSEAPSTFMDEMQVFYQHNAKTLRLGLLSARIGLYCVAPFMYEYHRAIIINIYDKDSVKVFYIDYDTIAEWQSWRKVVSEFCSPFATYILLTRANYPRPYLAVSVCGILIPGLSDTGTSCTLMTHRTWQTLKKLTINVIEKSATGSISTANGRICHIEGIISIPFEVSGRVLIVDTLLVPDLVSDLIFGMDFLKSFELVPNFANKIFEFASSPVTCSVIDKTRLTQAEYEALNHLTLYGGYDAEGVLYENQQLQVWICLGIPEVVDQLSEL